jgi:hypothetical protein
MFDGIYGQNAIDVYERPTLGGWVSREDPDNNQTSLVIDGVRTFGDFNYIDLQPDTSNAIITAFQIYANSGSFPTKYHIIGSNETDEWTSLYRETELIYEDTYPHGSNTGAYTSVTNLTKRDKHYRFVGILIDGHLNPKNAFVQELLLWGG